MINTEVTTPLGRVVFAITCTILSTPLLFMAAVYTDGIRQFVIPWLVYFNL